jgi:mRNA interferase MazF
MIKKEELTFGDVVWVQFDPSVGNEYRKKRPAVIIQSRDCLWRANLVSVVPLTSKVNNMVFDDILVKADKVNNLMTDSVVKVCYIASFDYQRLEKIIGRVNTETSDRIKKHLQKHFDL